MIPTSGSESRPPTTSRISGTKKTRMKVSGTALKGFAEARRSKGVLLPEIRSHVVEKAVQHNDADRSKTMLHVSELTKSDWCHRQAYYKLSHLEPTDIKAGINYRTEIIFGAGHNEHYKWQNWLVEMGIMWGEWYCPVCKEKWLGEKPEHEHPVSYSEVPLVDHEYQIIGHADGAVPYLKALVEIKTIGMGTVRFDAPELARRYTVKTVDGKSVVDYDSLWKDIRKPFRSHLLQARFYLWMCRRAGLPFEKMIFIYENKANQATKEFVIPYSETGLDPILTKISEVMDRIERGEGPPERPFLDPEKKPCVACLHRTRCWKGDVDTEEKPDRGDAAARHRRRIVTSASADVRDPQDAPTVPATVQPADSDERPGRHRGRRTDEAVPATGRVVRVHRRTTGVRRD